MKTLRILFFACLGLLGISFSAKPGYPTLEQLQHRAGTMSKATQRRLVTDLGSLDGGWDDNVIPHIYLSGAAFWGPLDAMALVLNRDAKGAPKQASEFRECRVVGLLSRGYLHLGKAAKNGLNRLLGELLSLKDKGLNLALHRLYWHLSRYNLGDKSEGRIKKLILAAQAVDRHIKRICAKHSKAILPVTHDYSERIAALGIRA